MARNAKKTTALVTGTVAVPAQTSDNEVAFIGKGDNSNLPISLADERLAASQAFADYDESGRKRSTSAQCMAYAVIGAHARMILDGDMKTSLSACITSKTSMGEMKTAMRKHFLPPMPPRNNDMNDAKITESDERRAHGNCISRGVEIAACLMFTGVPVDNYNKTTRNWSVLGINLFSANDQKRIPVGAPCRSRWVPLDGKGYGARAMPDEMGDEPTIRSMRSVDKFKASVSSAYRRAPNKKLTDAQVAADILPKLTLEGWRDALGPKQGLKLAIMGLHALLHTPGGEPTDIQQDQYDMKDGDWNKAQDVVRILYTVMKRFTAGKPLSGEITQNGAA